MSAVPQTITPHPFDAIRALALTVHFAVIAFLSLGWMMSSRYDLLAYTLLLPLIVMQWLFNRGSSIVSNLESWTRTGYWRDPANPYEGHLFQELLRKVGVRMSQEWICTLCVFALLAFWALGTFRMMLAET